MTGWRNAEGHHTAFWRTCSSPSGWYNEAMWPRWFVGESNVSAQRRLWIGVEASQGHCVGEGEVRFEQCCKQLPERLPLFISCKNLPFVVGVMFYYISQSNDVLISSAAHIWEMQTQEIVKQLSLNILWLKVHTDHLLSAIIRTLACLIIVFNNLLLIHSPFTTYPF